LTDPSPSQDDDDDDAAAEQELAANRRRRSAVWESAGQQRLRPLCLPRFFNSLPFVVAVERISREREKQSFSDPAVVPATARRQR
jgi:hypothetical protein